MVSEDLMDGKSDQLPAYRTYRRVKLDNAIRRASKHFAAPSWGYYDPERPPEHPLRIGRRKVAAFRAGIESDVRYPLVRDTPLDLSCPNFRRALGIPQDLQLTDPFWVKLLKFFSSGLPSHLNVRWAQHKLRSVRTFEGRRITFERTLSLLLAGPRLTYDESIDFALRSLRGTITVDALRTLGNRDPRWLRALRKLGLVSVADQLGFAAEPLPFDHAPLAEILVSEGAIATAAELLEWWPWETRDTGYRLALDSHQDLAAREVVRHLMRLGGDRYSVVAACLHAAPDFDRQKLISAVEYLESRGLQPSELAGSAGSQLWLAPMRLWKYLCEVVGIRTCAELALFDVFLKRSDRTPNERVAQALVSAGATSSGIAACQRLLLDCHWPYEEEGALLALKALSAPPFGFDAFMFGRISAYATRNAHLPEFLGVLVKHGLAQEDVVLTFEQCFKLVPAEFDQLLSLVLPLRGEASLSSVAEWVQVAGRMRAPDAFEVLVQLLGIETLGDVKRATRFAPLGVKVLRYLIVEKRLSTLKALLDWFYDRAEGVLEMGLSGPTLTDVERICLDDAFRRWSFGWVRHNVSEVRAASAARAAAVAGSMPLIEDDASRQRYQEQFEIIRAKQKPQLLADLEQVLLATDGIVLTRLLARRSDEDASIDETLAEFTPLLDALLAGHGPSGATLTDLEVDAICLVYRATPDVITSTWLQLIGREPDLESLKLAPSYPMTWRAEQHVLRDGAALDAARLGMLSTMCDRADMFLRERGSGMFEATKGLRPSRIGDKAADLFGLSQHLSVLCALGADDDLVKSALDHWRSIAEVMAEGSLQYSDVQRIENFFVTTLPDAVDFETRRFAAKLGTPDVDELARKLSPLQTHGPSPADRLHAAASHAMREVQRPFLKWARRERKKFVPVGAPDSETTLHAVLTKTPASFFGKVSAGLCTRADTDMWMEARHSHLVVFDQRNKRLAGMAMVYVQVIPHVDPVRPTLVIRAINPLEPYASRHNVSSIIDGFINTAITIAKDNHLAAVALPSNGSEHLLTNSSKVEEELNAAYFRSMRNHYQDEAVLAAVKNIDRPLKVAAPFSGYAEGKATVSWLCVLWVAGMDDAAASGKPANRRQASSHISGSI